MDSDHLNLLTRIAGSLETIAAPHAQTDKISELTAKLSKAEDNWRHWHTQTCLAQSQYLTLEKSTRGSRLLGQEKAEALSLKNEEFARLKSAHERQCLKIERLDLEHDAMLARVQAAEGRERALQRTVDELTKSDLGKLHAKYEAAIARLRRRAVVLNSRLGYWKRKKS